MTNLSSKYSDLFELKKTVNVFLWIRFFRDAYRKSKIVELISFFLWEFCHRFGFFKNKSYIKIINKKALLDNLNTLQHYIYLKEFNIKINKLKVNWKLLFIDKCNNLWGNTFSDKNILFKMAGDYTETLLIHKFTKEIKLIFVSSNNIIFVCTFGELYRCEDNKTFIKVLSLSLDNSILRHNNSFTEIPNEVFIAGEYGDRWENNKWQSCAYVYYSFDEGKTWVKDNFLIIRGFNKHVPFCKICNKLKCIVLTDGDNKKRLWINYNLDFLHRTLSLRNSGWMNLTKYHFRTGGYTAVVELDGNLMFGSDYLGGTNFIITTSDLKHFKKYIVPDPLRRYFFTDMVIRKANNTIEIWASLLIFNKANRANGCLLFSKDFGKTWVKIYEYDNSYYTDKIIISSSLHFTDNIYITIPNKSSNTTHNFSDL